MSKDYKSSTCILCDNHTIQKSDKHCQISQSTCTDDSRIENISMCDSVDHTHQSSIGPKSNEHTIEYEKKYTYTCSACEQYFHNWNKVVAHIRTRKHYENLQIKFKDKPNECMMTENGKTSKIDHTKRSNYIFYLKDSNKKITNKINSKIYKDYSIKGAINDQTIDDKYKEKCEKDCNEKENDAANLKILLKLPTNVVTKWNAHVADTLNNKSPHKITYRDHRFLINSLLRTTYHKLHELNPQKYSTIRDDDSSYLYLSVLYKEFIQATINLYFEQKLQCSMEEYDNNQSNPNNIPQTTLGVEEIFCKK